MVIGALGNRALRH